MSSSFTAPQVSEEQWEKEIASMTKEAQELRERDVFGKSNRRNRDDDDDDDDDGKQEKQQQPDSNHQQEEDEETEEFISDKIQRFDKEIEKLGETESLELAQFSCSEYIGSRTFKLMFLRAEQYDEKLAAKRMLKYWDDKVYFFGIEKAFRKITLSDLGEDDQVALNGGGVKVLSDKDESGRTILIWNRNLFDNGPRHEKNNGRYVWYVFHALLEDDSAQKNGVVVIIPPVKLLWLNRIIIRTVVKALPIRLVAIHLMPKIALSCSKLIYGQFLFLLGPFLRLRLIQHKHCSTAEDASNDWATHGISLEKLPRDAGGDLHYDYQDWLEKRRAQEHLEEQRYGEN